MKTKKQKFQTFFIMICGFFTLGISNLVWIYILSDKVDPINFLPMKQIVLTLITFGIYGIFWCNKMAKTVFNNIETRRNDIIFCTVFAFVFCAASIALIHSRLTLTNNEIIGG